MADTDRVTARSLRFERLLDAPVETVWQYIVDPELRGRWFMGGALDARPGGRIEMIFDHDRLSDDDVPMPERFAGNKGKRWYETISEIDAPHRIVFSWDEGKAGTVTIELTPIGADKTQLVLTHEGLRGLDDARNYGGGWHSHLAALQARIAGRGVPDFWALHAQSGARIAELLEHSA